MTFRVLLVAHRPPRHPVDGGDGCTTIGHHLLVHRPAGVEVTVVCPSDGRAMPSVVDEWVELPVGSGRMSRPGDLSVPRGVLRFDIPAARAVVADASVGADAVLALNHLVAPLLAAARTPARVAHLVDPDSLMAQASARTALGSDRIAALVRAQRHRTLERRLLRLGADLVVVSPDDARRLGAVHGVAVVAVPIGVPPVDPGRIPSSGHGPGTGLVFTGRLDWAPNIEAARSLVTEVLPRVRRVVPDATVRLVGAAPAPEVRALASSAVEVIPDSADLLAEYRRGAVAVFPGGHGWGIRGSVLQAFVAGIPVVASRASLCGQTLGPHAIVADDPATQADAVTKLLRDPTGWHSAAAASAAYGAAWPTWAASTQRLIAVLRAKQRVA